MSNSNAAIVVKDALKRGYATFARKNFGLLSVKTAVHDGDTVKVQLSGNFSIRFLGIDTPEMTLEYPKIGSTDDGKWLSIEKFENYLKDPFASAYPDSSKFEKSLGAGLVKHLKTVLGPNCATIHRELAEKAQRALEQMIIDEYMDRAKDGKHYTFFMVFSNEILDGYGRLLCYLYRNNTKTEQKQNPLSYNERMLKEGWGFPYFIWPNVVPFFYPGRAISESIPPADELKNWMSSSNATKLNSARNFTKDARNNGKGVFSQNTIAPFELRYLCRREIPKRYVLDLATCSKKLVKPTDYYSIKNHEDRLFVDSHYVDLFLKKGYQL